MRVFVPLGYGGRCWTFVCGTKQTVGQHSYLPFLSLKTPHIRHVLQRRPCMQNLMPLIQGETNLDEGEGNEESETSDSSPTKHSN